MTLPEKPKDKWINAKDFSWFFEYDNEQTISEEDWFWQMHVTTGVIMQLLADEADHNGIEIIRCKDCNNEDHGYCHYWESRIKKNGFCFKAERRTDE